MIEYPPSTVDVPVQVPNASATEGCRASVPSICGRVENVSDASEKGYGLVELTALPYVVE